MWMNFKVTIGNEIWNVQIYIANYQRVERLQGPYYVNLGTRKLMSEIPEDMNLGKVVRLARAWGVVGDHSSTTENAHGYSRHSGKVTVARFFETMEFPIAGIAEDDWIPIKWSD